MIVGTLKMSEEPDSKLWWCRQVRSEGFAAYIDAENPKMNKKTFAIEGKIKHLKELLNIY